MPRVRNCSTTHYSVWGRAINAEGMVDGQEMWLDTLAPGGVGDFPHHSELIVRDGNQDQRGARVAGPIREAVAHVGGADGGGSGAQCAAAGGLAAVPGSVGGKGWILAIVVIMALLATLLGVALSIALKQ